MPRAAKVAKYAEKFCRDVESCVKAVEESLRPSLGKKKDVPKPHDAKKLKIWSSLLCAAIKGPEQYSKKIIEVDRLTETLRDTNTREVPGASQELLACKQFNLIVVSWFGWLLGLIYALAYFRFIITF